MGNSGRKQSVKSSNGMESPPPPYAIPDTNGRCYLLSLPSELILEISSHLARSDIQQWMVTSKEIYRLGNSELSWMQYCLRAFPALFEIGHNPFFDRTSPIPWNVRAKVFSSFPLKLRAGDVNTLLDDMNSEEPEVIGRIAYEKEVSPDGRTHLNVGLKANVLAQQPFLTCNQNLSKDLSTLAPSVLYQGLEYFEMTVVKNTISWNRACAIAIATNNMQRRFSFVGWNDHSVAYHSDDGTVRCPKVFTCDPFSTGDVVGCGIDWKRSEVFFTKNGELQMSVVKGTLGSQYEWYPTIATMLPDDVMLVNFGTEPFVFDLLKYPTYRQEMVSASDVFHSEDDEGEAFG